MDLTVIVDNARTEGGLLSEHGLSVGIRLGQRSFIFDTSATPQALRANAELLSLDLASVEAVIISHGHPGHTGGLTALLAARPGLKVHASPAAFAHRWSDRPDRPMREISWHSGPDALASHGAVFCPVTDPGMLADGLLVSGPIGGRQGHADRYVIQQGDSLAADVFRDELFLMVRGAAGWAVLVGCCHRGLRNTLRLASFLAHGEPIQMVLGGLHLSGAGEGRLAEAAASLEEIGPEAIHPCHCTGSDGIRYLTERLPGKVHPLHCGMQLSL